MTLRVDRPLSGCVALVTGAARRTGRSIALALAEAGADIAVHYYRSEEEALQLVEEISRGGQRAQAIGVDLNDADATAKAFAKVASELGGLDILVNNASGIIWKSLSQMSIAEWHQGVSETLHITYHACQAALPFLRQSGQGRIINLIDVDADAIVAVPKLTPYKIGKTGVLMLTQTLAVSEAPFGITVNGLSPGTLNNSERKPSLDQIPAGRYGTPEEVARAAVFLAHPDSSYITGSNLKISGGYLI
ncbi:MAG: SDR family oxidoreductase [Methylococcus sp.]|nr:MAG: SDR family oxidoreductase [Methylococcus sp.]